MGSDDDVPPLDPVSPADPAIEPELGLVPKADFDREKSTPETGPDLETSADRETPSDRENSTQENNVVRLSSRRSGGYLPLITVSLTVAASLALLLVDFRLGVAALAGSVGLAWLLRAVLPEKRAGLLVVRSRIFDLSFLAFLTVALVVLAIIVPAPPR